MVVNGVGGDVCLMKGSSGSAFKRNTPIAIPFPVAEPAEVRRFLGFHASRCPLSRLAQTMSNNLSRNPNCLTQLLHASSNTEFVGNAQRSPRMRALPVPAFVVFAAALGFRECAEHMLRLCQ